MLKNHLTSILRNLSRYKGYTLVTISGLAIGFASAMLIAIYVYQEFTFDTHHRDHERIYRLSNRTFAFSSIAHLDYLKASLAGVEATVSLMPNPSGTLTFDEVSFVEKATYYGTRDYFRVFEQELVLGNAGTAFDDPEALILTEAMAGKLFGHENPLGKTLEVTTQLSSDRYRVTGVIKDPPANAHLKFQVLARLPAALEAQVRENFSYTTGYCYFRFESAVPAPVIQEKTDVLFARNMHERYGADQDFDTYLKENRNAQPWILNIADVHLDSDLQFEASPPGKRPYLYIFLGIALFIVMLAAINYINLATAQASRKAKEVGVRKVLGSHGNQLILRFLLESVLLASFAAIIGLGLAEVMLQLIRLEGFAFDGNVYDFPQLIGMLAGLALVTGVIAGIYPAFYLTSFQPSAVLKGDYKVGEKSRWFRNALVIFQFVVSLTLAVFTVFIYQQLNYSLQKDLGFDKENVVVIDNTKAQLGSDHEYTAAFKHEILKNPDVVNASFGHHSMVDRLPLGRVRRIGGTYESVRVQYKYVDSEFIPTMGFTLIRGRNFDPDLATDRQGVIINRTLADQLGGDVLEMELDAGFNGREVRVIGVVEDFHYKDMSTRIGPAVFFNRHSPTQVNVRISGLNVRKTLQEIGSVWSRFTDDPFEYYFLEERFDQLFAAEKRLSRIITLFTGLSIFVAFLGLTGLISYTLDQRWKEIGIRKVLGASVVQILDLFSRALGKLIIIAFLITVPLGFYVTSHWLNTFAYHITIRVMPFVWVGVSGLLITLLVILWRTIRTALANPVHALRNE